MAAPGVGTLADDFQRQGHVVLRGVVDDEVVRRGRSAAALEIEQVRAAAPERSWVDYDSATGLSERNPALRAVVHAPQLARQAALALGVERVRLLYDQLFAKPPGAVGTMWHQDQIYVPIDASDVVDDGGVGMARGWVTLTALPPEVGGLHFVDGSHRFGSLDGADVEVVAPGCGATATIDGRELPITDYGAFGAGDATLHAGYTLHGARPNPTDRTRYAVAVAYVPDGARLADPVDELQAISIALHTPGKKPGDLIDSDANPILWPAEDAR